jgi:aspartokinase
VLESSAAPAGVLELLDERGVAGKQLHVAGGQTRLAISRENLHDESRLREALQSRFEGRARLVDGLGAVSAIGSGITATYGNVRRGSAVLAEAGIAPAAIATSSFRITWMIPRDTTDEAVRLLHQCFIEADRPLLP